MLNERALASCHEDTLDIEGSATEPAPAQHAFPAQCFKAAALAAPRGSAISAKAWASYADWLFGQHAECVDVRIGSEMHSASPPAGHGSSGQATGDKTADDHKESATREPHNFELEALQAYCTFLESAGQSVGQSGSPEDHVAALLRVLQVPPDVMCASMLNNKGSQLHLYGVGREQTAMLSVQPHHGCLFFKVPPILMLNV